MSVLKGGEAVVSSAASLVVFVVLGPIVLAILGPVGWTGGGGYVTIVVLGDGGGVNGD